MRAFGFTAGASLVSLWPCVFFNYCAVRLEVGEKGNRSGISGARAVCTPHRRNPRIHRNRPTAHSPQKAPQRTGLRAHYCGFSLAAAAASLGERSAAAWTAASQELQQDQQQPFQHYEQHHRE